MESERLPNPINPAQVKSYGRYCTTIKKEQTTWMELGTSKKNVSVDVQSVLKLT